MIRMALVGARRVSVDGCEKSVRFIGRERVYVLPRSLRSTQP